MLPSPITPALIVANAAVDQLNGIENTVIKGFAGRQAQPNVPAIPAVSAEDFLAAVPEPTRGVFKIVAALVNQTDEAKLAAALAALQ